MVAVRITKGEKKLIAAYVSGRLKSFKEPLKGSDVSAIADEALELLKRQLGRQVKNEVRRQVAREKK